MNEHVESAGLRPPFVAAKIHYLAAYIGIDALVYTEDAGSRNSLNLWSPQSRKH